MVINNLNGDQGKGNITRLDLNLHLSSLLKTWTAFSKKTRRVVLNNNNCSDGDLILRSGKRNILTPFFLEIWTAFSKTENTLAASCPVTTADGYFGFFMVVQMATRVELTNSGTDVKGFGLWRSFVLEQWVDCCFLDRKRSSGSVGADCFMFVAFSVSTLIEKLYNVSLSWIARQNKEKQKKGRADLSCGNSRWSSYTVSSLILYMPPFIFKCVQPFCRCGHPIFLFLFYLLLLVVVILS